MLAAVWMTLAELAPWLLLGAAVSGLLHALLPDGLVQRQLRGVPGVFKAVAFGVPLPLCSCGVIPAGVGLKRDGASDGASVAFLISTPQTGVDSVLVSAAFLGWPFALFKVGAAVVTGVTGGLLTEFFGGPSAPLVDAGRAGGQEQGPAWRRAWEHADEVIGTIWGWLVFGVLVSAALQTWVPAESLSETAIGGGVLASLLVLVISLPLYVCATASVPIAAGLLHAGLPPGAALVFLMAGPASNVATIGAVYRTFGARVLGIYLGTVALGSLGLGLLFDAVLATTVPAAAMHEHTSPWATAAVVVLLVLLARYAARDLSAWWAARQAPVQAQVLELTVGGITCGGCARKVDKAARAVPGVVDVQVQVEGGQVKVYGLADPTRVREAIRDAGFAPGA